MRKDLAEAIKPKNIDGAGRLVLNPDEKFGDYLDKTRRGDAYAGFTYHHSGWRLASNFTKTWPVHCYGMVGVGRNLSPDTGTGAELYTVIGHAPRHLDRNIALVGRVIEGIEHMSSLPRGKGQLGFYEDPAKRVPILSVRIGKTTSSSAAVGEQTTSSSAAVGEQTTSSSAAVGEQTLPRFEYLSTESKTFAAYARARANRRDPFFNVPAGGADICNIPVPIRRVED
jgi:peptidylprolyl isomerase